MRLTRIITRRFALGKLVKYCLDPVASVFFLKCKKLFRTKEKEKRKKERKKGKERSFHFERR